MFSSDDLADIKQIIKSNLIPNERHQSCWVHLSRNVSYSVRTKDKSEALSNLNDV
jgi:transposase-like protein